jgi:myo-inositol-1(or 4)-monophosphatase
MKGLWWKISKQKFDSVCPMTENLRTYLDFANETAYLAGKITLGYYQSNLDIETKEDGSFVTDADKKSEQLIRKRIEKYFPDHALLGEEFGQVKKIDSRYRWIIDPIDGTRSFVHGVPLYAVLIGLEIDGVVEIGIAHFPALNETLSAATGEGCYWNNLRTSVSNLKTLSDGLVLCNDPETIYRRGYGPAWDRIKKVCKARRGWSDAYGYLLVATGRAAVMLDPLMNVWDCGPFPPIFREAGGFFGTWQGEETIYGGEAMGTTKRLLPELLELIGTPTQ